MTPAIHLQEWQKRYVEDTSRRKLLVKSVQVGGSFIAALEVCLDCLSHRTMWIMLSASDRQSMELMEKVKMHTAGAAVVVESDFFEETKIVQHTAKFPNGSRIIALPANPDTARGYSGNVLLDEFAIHRAAKEIWKAMVGRTMREGYKLRVLSSFKGKQNKFYELAKELGLADGVAPEPNPVNNGTWSGHWVDIHSAVAQGLNVDIDELRRTVGDEDIWNEEFCCIPTDGAQDFIGLELVLQCESPAASTLFEAEARPGRYFGFDIARKRDLSIIWILDLLDDGAKRTSGVITMARMPFHQQKEIARGVASICERGCIDATGIGANLAEDLSLEFPGRIEGVEFNLGNKERMATALKTDMETHQVLLPAGELAIRRSMQAVKKYTGSTGNVRFDAARTDQGHADEFWALALANSAAQTSANYVPASECGLVGRTVMGNVMARNF